jgi:PHD/YefM family antitoxin component YafN of YafNO toxin-antitoxin module
MDLFIVTDNCESDMIVFANFKDALDFSKSNNNKPLFITRKNLQNVVYLAKIKHEALTDKDTDYIETIVFSTLERAQQYAKNNKYIDKGNNIWRKKYEEINIEEHVLN